VKNKVIEAVHTVDWPLWIIGSVIIDALRVTPFDTSSFGFKFFVNELKWFLLYVFKVHVGYMLKCFKLFVSVTYDFLSS